MGRRVRVETAHRATSFAARRAEPPRGEACSRPRRRRGASRRGADSYGYIKWALTRENGTGTAQAVVRTSERSRGSIASTRRPRPRGRARASGSGVRRRLSRTSSEDVIAPRGVGRRRPAIRGGRGGRPRGEGGRQRGGRGHTPRGARQSPSHPARATRPTSSPPNAWSLSSRLSSAARARGARGAPRAAPRRRRTRDRRTTPFGTRPRGWREAEGWREEPAERGDERAGMPRRITARSGFGSDVTAHQSRKGTFTENHDRPPVNPFQTRERSLKSTPALAWSSAVTRRPRPRHTFGRAARSLARVFSTSAKKPTPSKPGAREHRQLLQQARARRGRREVAVARGSPRFGSAAMPSRKTRLRRRAGPAAPRPTPRLRIPPTRSRHRRGPSPRSWTATGGVSAVASSRRD